MLTQELFALVAWDDCLSYLTYEKGQVYLEDFSSLQSLVSSLSHVCLNILWFLNSVAGISSFHCNSLSSVNESLSLNLYYLSMHSYTDLLVLQLSTFSSAILSTMPALILNYNQVAVAHYEIKLKLNPFTNMVFCPR